MKYGIRHGTGNALMGRDEVPSKDVAEGNTEKSAKKVIQKKKATAFGKLKK